MTSTKDKMEFCFLMARHSAARLSACIRLLRYGSTHKRLMEYDCNTGLDAKERDKLKHIQRKIQLLCGEFQGKAVFQGDPRGATVKIAVPDGYTTDWGKVGICVPTS